LFVATWDIEDGSKSPITPTLNSISVHYPPLILDFDHIEPNYFANRRFHRSLGRLVIRILLIPTH
jgi:hypothetical protein